MKHNELMNIWTHLIGSLVFIILIVFLITNKHYSTQIYKELKSDFENFHIDKFNETFKNEILHFIDKIK